ncbi:MAG: anion transporter [Deltaproteobacteria bacterium]|nr:anion transporter [Deltaproteobacteria bacterium]
MSALIILAVVFILVAVRQAGFLRLHINLHIWQIMLLGALTALLTGAIAPVDALRAVNFDVIFFLAGMFVVGTALHDSGYLEELSHLFFSRARSTGVLVCLILFVMGMLSVFLMNDTVAIIGTPLVLTYADRHNMPHKLMLLALCFAVTIGSVASPMGNPQNLIIAGAVASPFIVFFKYLLIPTFINLFLAYVVLKIFYRDAFHKNQLECFEANPVDRKLAFLSKLSMLVISALAGVKIVLVLAGAGFDFKLSWIALIAACVPLAFSPKRWRILKGIDWATLVFFAAMFVLMDAVWRSGALQYALKEWFSRDGLLSSTDFILAASVIVSQFVSNVPFVAMYLPLLKGAAASNAAMMALAAGSTIAGNLFILGAASNVIIIQNAERKGHTLTFLEFARVGLPLTVVNVLVYWVYLRWMG